MIGAIERIRTANTQHLKLVTLPVGLRSHAWWIHGESNPNLRPAEALCSRYHYGPRFGAPNGSRTRLRRLKVCYPSR